MTNRCPITYEDLTSGEKYSRAGLKKLSPQLTELNDLPLSAELLRVEARKRATKMSIQGVQPKLSAIFKPAQEMFEIVDQGGVYILKPPLELYAEVPENEDLTMKLAAEIGIETPFHGMVYGADGLRTYFIRRFDRLSRGEKCPLEDFAQLAGLTRDTKYSLSTERLVQMIDTFCTFPLLEKQKFWLRLLFCFVTGNEDMHAKNFSLITRESKIELSPAYDLLNTTLATENAKEELALPLAGRKATLQRKHLIDYLAQERMKLNPATIEEGLSRFTAAWPKWKTLIQRSFLKPTSQTAYLTLMTERFGRLGLTIS